MNDKQHNNHVIRRSLEQARNEHKNHGCYSSPDGYYNAKDYIKRLEKMLTGKTYMMYFWHGGMSN